LEWQDGIEVVPVALLALLPLPDSARNLANIANEFSGRALINHMLVPTQILKK
jgi:hypothetical protein